MPHWYIDWNIQVEHFANKGNTLVELQGLTMVHLRPVQTQILDQHGLHQIIGRTVPLGGRPANQSLGLWVLLPLGHVHRGNRRARAEA